jgi:hypothetical protein
MRRALVFATIAMVMGCDSRKPLTVVENCLMKGEGGWSQIKPPQESTAFLAMPVSDPDGTPRLVGEQLVAGIAEREVWLKNTDGRILACIYTPTRQDVCDAGMPRAFEFKRSASGWDATKLNPFCLQ